MIALIVLNNAILNALYSKQNLAFNVLFLSWIFAAQE